MTDDAATGAAPAPVSWREAAVARSLDSARSRAEQRVQRFLDAALELMAEDPGREFTVQEVVERSGQSLRSFYLYFGGKQELMLALFEEAVRATTELLRKATAKSDDPLERLHRFVVEYHRLCRPARANGQKKPAAPPVMSEFAQQLLTANPKEASQAFAPLVGLFGEILDAAADAGHVRDGLHRDAVAGVVLEAIMFNAFSATIGGRGANADGDPGEELWDLLFHGFGAT